MPELRKDPIVERWVIISTERSKRPNDFSTPAVTKKSDNCPFCEGRENLTPPEVFSVRGSGKPDSPGWKVRVVPNKFPALSNDGEPLRSSDGIYESMNGAGIHEVIIETPDHDKTLADLDPDSFLATMSTYRNRLLHHADDPRLEYIIIFRNNGLLAGASLPHPHSQLIGLPLMPVAIKEELDSGNEFMKKNGSCIFCEMITQERKSGARIISENDEFIALCPYAPRFSFEGWVFPKRHASDFEGMDDRMLSSFSELFRTTLCRYRDVLNDPPYNFMLHTAPIRSRNLKHFHWHIEIAPLLSHIAGFEKGTGFYINPTSPEDAARYLRLE